MGRSVFYFTDSQAFGGAEQSLFTLMGALDRSAWEPTLLVSDSPVAGELRERARALDIPVQIVPPLPLGGAGLRRLPGFTRMLARERPAVFHASLSAPLACKFALTAAILARVEAVLGTVQLFPPFPITASSRRQLRLLASRMGRILAVSRAIESQLVGDLGWPADKVRVVYNAVTPAPPPSSDRAELRRALAGGPDRPIVLMAARLNEQKGHDVLLAAAAQLPDALFALAGDGPERARLETLAAELGVSDRVRFLGQRDDVAELLDVCDVFALPSLYEGSSLAVLEAMAAGVAVVTSDIPGTNELIRDGDSGLLTPPGEAGPLADALRSVLDDPDLRRGLGERARERALSDFSPQAMARSVTAQYASLLGDPGGAENAVLRAADWRFLLRLDQRPGALNLAHGRLAQGIPEVADEPSGDHPADLVVLSGPGPGDLSRAHASLRPGGEVVAQWTRPRPDGIRAARRELAAAGFADIRVYWPGPDPAAPEFWLPLGSPAARAHVLRHRPASGLRRRLLRFGWHGALRSGMLAPLYGIARVPPESGAPPAPAPLLLTGGRRPINKAVSLDFDDLSGRPARVVKFARVAEAEPSLRHEAATLRTLARLHPDLGGVPRVLSEERRAGQFGVAESAVSGIPLLDRLSSGSFGELAGKVTDWLVGLGAHGPATPRTEWWERLVGQPLDTFASQFGPVLAPGTLQAISSRLETLGDLPLVFEHRDCSPWNVVLDELGNPGLLDWESAEPYGLPCCDLIYFLANAGFVLDGALEDGSTRKTYHGLLDRRSQYGSVAADCLTGYCARLGVETRDLPSLRLLTWVIHSRSDFRHLEIEGRADAVTLGRGMFLGLIEEELQCRTG